MKKVMIFFGAVLLIVASIGSGILLAKSKNDKQNKEGSINTYEGAKHSNIIQVDISEEPIANNNKVKFKVKTNLPENTELMATLSDFYEYNAQDKFSVINGQAETAEFSDKNKGLKKGIYRIEIDCPVANVQPQSVQDIIGKDGANLKGKYVVEDASIGRTLHFENVIEVLEDGSVINFDENQSKGESLVQSIRVKNKEDIDRYIKEGADVNFLSKYIRVTPLMMACLVEDESLINKLLDAGADINKRNDLGATAIFYCGQKQKILNLLKSRGADMNVKNNDGGTYRNSVKFSDTDETSYTNNVNTTNTSAKINSTGVTKTNDDVNATSPANDQGTSRKVTEEEATKIIQNKYGSKFYIYKDTTYGNMSLLQDKYYFFMCDDFGDDAIPCVDRQTGKRYKLYSNGQYRLDK
ncbi:ankyrin repeat domain-containing protein [Clostridium aciditolerans]|uniref:Uncharacterized protein n=1 Tax=Clostridium aciditolerans TaxID=339861 RepID=A0A934I0Q6_9CLOT|nr:ankyrin repeat domain-containing protein [Clostridium aciditolerans]MBI6875614.1 hypothetical protein [Clostridium aciditolerans]